MNQSKTQPAFTSPRTLLIVLLCVSTVVVSTLFGLYIVTKEQSEAVSLQQRLRSETLSNLAIASATLVWDLNEVALQDALMAQMNLPDLMGVKVFQGTQGHQELFAEVRRPGFSWEEGRRDLVVFSTPLLRGTREIGRLDVAFSEHFFSASGKQRIRAVLIQNGIISLVLGALVVIFTMQKRAQKFLEAKSEELANANRDLENEINERKVLEQNLRQSRDEARLANKVKQEFLANMSHELRTPLNGILGLTRLLSSGPNATAEELECFGLLYESGESLQTHLDDILTYTALESGRLSLRATEFELPVLLEELLARSRALASRKGLGCETKVEGDTPKRVTGDRQELQRSVMALVQNAIKFTSKDSIWIRISWVPEKLCLRVNVRDSGPGVPKEIEEKIYGPFVQLDTSASRRHSGLGLGLALASRVVKIAGGSIRCLNPGEPGAIFELLFPLHPASPATAAQGDALQPASDFSSTALRILAVDDNDLNRRVLRLILAKAGIASDEAASGEEALKFLQTQSFDLIFMDVQMPGMDGLETTRRIRADIPAEKQPFIIALTAHALPSDRQLCLDAGMDEYLSKPVEAARLLRWIDRLRRLPPALRGKLSASGK